MTSSFFYPFNNSLLQESSHNRRKNVLVIKVVFSRDGIILKHVCIKELVIHYITSLEKQNAGLPGKYILIET